MITKQAVEEQLKRIGCNFRFWGRSEVNELGRILMDDEIIAECVNGQYANGFAMLVATNHRILLVDKKPLLYLTVEDVRYEMITEFNYNHRLLDATIKFFTANKTMIFTSWNQHRLRKLMEYGQARVLEMRQQQHLAQQFQAAAAAQYAQLHAVQMHTQRNAPHYEPNLAPSPAAYNPSLPAYASPVPQSVAGQASDPSVYGEPAEPQHHLAAEMADIASRLAHKRAVLGTYTRNKLPTFRLKPNAPAEPANGSSLSNLPLEYEG